MLATRTKIQRKQTAVVFGCVLWRLTRKRQTQENKRVQFLLDARILNWLYPLYMDGVAFSPIHDTFAGVINSVIKVFPY